MVGLGECLRSELHRHRAGVTTRGPELIESDLIKNTHFKLVDEQARALSNMVKPMAADTFARRVVDAVRRNRGVVVMTALAKFLWSAKRLSPRGYEMMSLLVALGTRKHVHG